jgi:hypothetical protein
MEPIRKNIVIANIAMTNAHGLCEMSLYKISVNCFESIIIEQKYTFYFSCKHTAI